jgi:UDP-4-amino-4,6-dideoxy-N-acetyl-beta-L-altrosamine transaminase
MIPYGKQDIKQSDIDSVLEVLQSDFLTQGPKVPLFEETVAKKVEADYAVAVNSATSALHIACMALGLGQNDWLWTSPITFVASANCGLYCGAKVDFVDIDSQTFNLCPKALECKLVEAEKKGRLPKVLVAVHLCGQPCDMKAIHELSKRFGFYVIEDASHAIGGKYRGEYIGNCRYSDITVFSFHPVKIITTAEGGMALTKDSKLFKKMELLRSHGITRDESMMEENTHGGWYYEQIELGYNYRMTELQAALGISQMERLDDFVTARHSLANIYNKELSELPIDLPFQLENTYSGMHLYVIRLNLNKIKKSHKKVFEELRERGVGVNLHYIPVHIQPYYKRMGFDWGDFPVAESYYQEAISIPIFHGLTHDQQNEVIATLVEVLAS